MKSYNEKDYWGDANYVYWDRSLFENSVLKNEDISVLCDLGIPSWVAPNMHFESMTPSGSVLNLGEDRDDRAIYVCLCSGTVYLDTSIFMNSSVNVMRKSLQQYALMVEKALLSNKNAVIENKIPGKLIEEFRNELLKIDPKAVAENTYWSKEILRIST